MRLVYKPEGAEEAQEWPVDLGRLRTMEVEAIERLTGYDYGTEFKQRLMKGNSLARRALLYTFQRRTHPTLRFVDVDFADAELELAMDHAELVELRKAVEDAPGVSEAERPAVLAELDRQIAEHEPEGKALSPSDGDATG